MDEVTNKTGIPAVQENREKEGWVNALALFYKLKSKDKRNFYQWFKARCNRFKLVNDVDYCIIPSKDRNGATYYFSQNAVEKMMAFEHRYHVIKNLQIKTFYFAEYKLRATFLDGKPWFFMTDVCIIFGVDDRHKALGRLESNVNKITILTNIGDTIAPAPYHLVDVIGLHYMFFRTERRSFFLKACNWLVYELMPQISKAFPTEKTSVFDKVIHFFKTFAGGVK
jgi:phage anti-repressor protein